MRLFAAISIPEPMRQRLAEWTQDLAHEIPDPQRRLHWVKQSQFHITLKFFGETRERQIPSLQSALRLTAKSHSKFSLTLGQTGHFGGRVIWMGLEHGRDKVIKIVESIDECLPLGITRESKPIHPHITLARSKRNPGTIRLDRLAVPSDPELFRPYSVEAIDLIRSTLAPQGSIYDLVESYGFSG